MRTQAWRIRSIFFGWWSAHWRCCLLWFRRLLDCPVAVSRALLPSLSCSSLCWRVRCTSAYKQVATVVSPTIVISGHQPETDKCPVPEWALSGWAAWFICRLISGRCRVNPAYYCSKIHNTRVALTAKIRRDSNGEIVVRPIWTSSALCSLLDYPSADRYVTPQNANLSRRRISDKNALEPQA